MMALRVRSTGRDTIKLNILLVTTRLLQPTLRSRRAGINEERPTLPWASPRYLIIPQRSEGNLNLQLSRRENFHSKIGPLALKATLEWAQEASSGNETFMSKNENWVLIPTWITVAATLNAQYSVIFTEYTCILELIAWRKIGRGY